MGDEIDRRIDSLKEVIRKTPAELLQERVYTCIANGCILLTAYKQQKGAPGWSSKLHTDGDEPMLTKDQQRQIEDIFQKAPWLLDMLDERGAAQTGGAAPPFKIPTLKVPGSEFVKKVELPSSQGLNGDDVSLDLAFESFLKKSDEMDDYWGKFAYESPGFAKLLNSDLIIPPTPITPFPIPISKKLIAGFLILLLDSLRLSYSLTGRKSNLLTLVVLMEEIVTGQWRQMLLTSAGFISPSGVAIGVIFKYIVNTWMLISPDLRTQIAKDMYKGSKSIFIGFLLWAATTLPPHTLLVPVEEALDKARSMIEGLDSKLDRLAERGSAALAPYGKRMDFKGFDLSKLTKISMNDIQNLQALAQWNMIVCTSDFQEIIVPLQQNPIFRLIIEMMNIPTTPSDKYALCGAEPYKPISDVIEGGLEPVITETGEAEAAPEPEAAPEAAPEPEAEAPALAKEAEAKPEPEAAPEAAPEEEPEAQPKAKKAKKAKKGGSRIAPLKLKKSTRFRKATPRRQTRQLPRQRDGVKRSKTL